MWRKKLCVPAGTLAQFIAGDAGSNTRSGLTELNGNLIAVGKSRNGQSHGPGRRRGGRASAASILSREQESNGENGGNTRDQSHGTILAWNQEPRRLSLEYCALSADVPADAGPEVRMEEAPAPAATGWALRSSNAVSSQWPSRHRRI